MNEDTLYFDVASGVTYQLKTLQNSKNMAVFDSSLQRDKRGFYNNTQFFKIILIHTDIC